MSKRISMSYNEDMQRVRDTLRTMFDLVRVQVDDGITSLLELDAKIAEKVKASDYKLNALELDLDDQCANIIALRNPQASDMRTIFTIIKITKDLERIGDQAEKLGNLSLDVAQRNIDLEVVQSMSNLCRQVSALLRDTVQAFLDKDMALALACMRQDEQVDKEYGRIIRQLITHMIEHPEQIKSILRLLWCVRSLERIADHSCNICEYLVYMVSGHDVRHLSMQEKIDELTPLIQDS